MVFTMKLGYKRIFEVIFYFCNDSELNIIFKTKPSLIGCLLCCPLSRKQSLVVGWISYRISLLVLVTSIKAGHWGTFSFNLNTVFQLGTKLDIRL